MLTREALRPAFGVAPELVKPSPWTAGGVSAVLALVVGSALLAAGPAQAAVPQAPAGATQVSAPAASTKLVDINKAGRGELKTLPGIGDAEAAKIIGARPYMTKTDLVTKNVLTLQAYDDLRNKVVVVHKGPPPKPKP
jgi:DNA uptake protein ComE-like DNA-binding protein